MTTRNFFLVPALLIALLPLAGCDQLGIETPAMKTAAREAEGRAIGAACRHAGRAIEDCFALNPRAHKAAIFAGWKDMNDYMRENKISEVKPASELASQSPAAAEAKSTDGSADSAPELPPAKGKVTSSAADPRDRHGVQRATLSM